MPMRCLLLYYMYKPYEQQVSPECPATQEEYRLERFVDEHYDRFTRNQMESYPVRQGMRPC